LLLFFKESLTLQLQTGISSDCYQPLQTVVTPPKCSDSNFVFKPFNHTGTFYPVDSSGRSKHTFAKQ